ncbi:hypothetical protein HDU76_005054 [Blyttiomyces sp. JEL0837]|nr:hypothetical protein HDU76_005054 [Blyttiomyces sp. JEL0837]
MPTLQELEGSPPIPPVRNTKPKSPPRSSTMATIPYRPVPESSSQSPATGPTTTTKEKDPATARKRRLTIGGVTTAFFALSPRNSITSVSKSNESTPTRFSQQRHRERPDEDSDDSDRRSVDRIGDAVQKSFTKLPYRPMQSGFSEFRFTESPRESTATRNENVRNPIKPPTPLPQPPSSPTVLVINPSYYELPPSPSTQSQQTPPPLPSPTSIPQSQFFRPTTPTSTTPKSTTPTPPIIFITGVSIGGIGHALCLAFARRGCRVFGTVRRIEAMNDLDGIPCEPGSVEVIPMDVLDRESIRRAVGAVVGRVGRIDVLVNNAGIGHSGAMADCVIDDLRVAFETNVLGLMSVTQEVLPHMIARRSGKIVNMGSMVCYISLPWSGGYVATKAALRAITSALRMELLPFNIQVSLVTAGSVRTNIIRNTFRRYDLQNRHPSPLYKNLSIGPPSNLLKEERPQDISGTDADIFAKSIVKMTLRERMPATIMTGKWAWIILVLLWFPEFVIEWVLAWRYGLSIVKVTGGVEAIGRHIFVLIELGLKLMMR